MASTRVATDLVVVEDPSGWTEAGAVAGFLAAYGGSTRVSYATDLRLFAAWCREANLTLFGVRRAHLELFGRWMEERGLMRSTVARRLSTLTSFYRYCQEEHIDRSPALNLRRPKVDWESRTLGLDRNELGGFLVQAGIGSPRNHALAVLLAVNGCGSPKHWGRKSATWTTSVATGPSRSSARAAAGDHPLGPTDLPGSRPLHR